MLSSCKLLGVRSFVPEVGSRSGNDVPVNLHQTNVIVCSDKKGQGPKAQLLPCEVQVLAKRMQVSVGSSLRARSPDPAQLSLLREPGAQGPTRPQALQATNIWGGREAGSTDCDPRRLPLPLGHRGRDGGKVHCRLKAWAWSAGGLGEGSGGLQDTAPCLFHGPPAHPPIQEGLREGQDSPLTLLSTSQQPFHQPLAEQVLN